MEIIQTENAPKAIGPYSQAVKSGGFVFLSGQIPLTTDGQIVSGGVVDQAKQVMQNLEAVLKAAGTGLEKVIKTTIYLSSMDDFVAVNEVYAAYFSGDHKPARATVEVSRLPKDVLVEIDMIAEA